MKYPLSCLFIVIICSCQSEPQPDIQKLSLIYVDLLVAEETYRGMPDSLLMVKNKIFSDYGITNEEYNESFMSIEGNSEEWNLFFENALTYLDSLRARGKKVKLDSLQVQP
jgi:hypothetical protein